MDAEQDALEYWIDAAWLATEQNVPQHGGGRGGGVSASARADRRHRERRPKPSEHSSSSSRNNSEEPPTCRRGSSGSSQNRDPLPNEPQPPLPPQRAWSASTQEEARQQPDNLTRLQRNIEQLERKIATAAVVLSEAERRALRRKEAKRRHETRGAITRTVSSLQLDQPSELEGSAHARDRSPESARDGAWRLQLLSAWQGMQAAAARGRAAQRQETSADRRSAGLAVVLSALAGARLDGGDAGAGGGEAAAARSAAALQLAGAARDLWSQLGSGEPHEPRWKRRAAAAVALQRTQRGRAARAAVAPLAAAQDAT